MSSQRERETQCLTDVLEGLLEAIGAVRAVRRVDACSGRGVNGSRILILASQTIPLIPRQRPTVVSAVHPPPPGHRKKEARHLDPEQDGPLEYGPGAGGQRGQPGYADVGDGAGEGSVRVWKERQGKVLLHQREVYGPGVERDSNDHDCRREAWA